MTMSMVTITKVMRMGRIIKGITGMCTAE